MPTILTHPVVPLVIGLGLGRSTISRRLLTAGVVASVLPDVDVIAFSLGIPYGSALAHRGLTHSLAFAAAIGTIGAVAFRLLDTRVWAAFWFLFVAAASHGVLDAFTTGGSGIAFLWPFSEERHFAPTQVIEVSPIGVVRFFSARGVAVLFSELTWVWLPGLLLLSTALLARRKMQANRT